MKMTIYLPDSLAAEVRTVLGDTNISAVCQDALRAELDRVKARALLEDGFERVEAYDGPNAEHVAFQGRQIGQSREDDVTAYLTEHGGIAVVDGRNERLDYYSDGHGSPDYGVFAEHGYPDDLVRDVADALGEKYVRELDI